MVDGLLNRKPTAALPSLGSGTEVAESFNHFFTEKIEKLKAKLPPTSEKSVSLEANPEIDCPSFSEIRPLDDKAVKDIIIKSKSTICELYLIPTWLL